MNVFLKHALLLFVSLALVASVVLFLPMPADDSQALQTVRFGYPFPFLTQDFSEYTIEFVDFRRFVRFELDRPVTHFSVGHFLASFSIALLSVELVVWLLEYWKWRRDKSSSVRI
jgi:hypothetical protein